MEKQARLTQGKTTVCKAGILEILEARQGYVSRKRQLQQHGVSGGYQRCLTGLLPSPQTQALTGILSAPLTQAPAGYFLALH